MTFAELQFVHRTPQFPWAEAAIEKVAFRECAVRAMLDEVGSHYENDYVSEAARLLAFYETRGQLVDEHAQACDWFFQNIGRYEARALSCLYSIARGVVKEASDCHISGWGGHFSEGLPGFIEKYFLDAPAGIVNLVEWKGLSVFDHGFDGRGLITLDFSCGWDEEHGVSLLMHDARLIEVSGLADFANRGDSLIAVAKDRQRNCSYSYDIAL